MKTDNASLPILVSWFGTSDIIAMDSWRVTNNLPAVEENFDCKKSFIEEQGINDPFRTFSDNKKFDKIYILTSKEYEKYAPFVKEWITRGNSSCCKIIKTGVEDPTSYDEVYKAIDSFFQKYWSKEDASRFVYNLTPGTPATQAMLFYMAQVRYPGGKTYRTVQKTYAKDNKQILEVNAPFNIHTDLYSLPQFGHIETDELEKIISIYAPVKAVNILLLGESGVGKTSAARKIHFECGGTESNFIEANCAELAAGDGNMFRAELFGAKKGSFTGCVEDITGLFEKASGGTLFLDEIAEIPLSCQSILLRALQEKTVNPIGSKKVIRIENVRIIAATNHNLIEDVKTGKFREDLYYRVAMCPITLPSLRYICNTNPEQFKKVVNNSLSDISKEDSKFNQVQWQITDDAWDCLLHYSWPGNMRQLRHVLLLSCVYTLSFNSNVIDKNIIGMHLAKLNSEILGNRDDNDFIPNDLNQWLNDHKKLFIEKALEQSNQNVSKAAELLGLNKQTLHSILRK